MGERDIVQRLRAPAYWMSGSAQGHEGENDAPREAANEIDRLRAHAEAMAEALRAIEHWANARCPVHNDLPDPCPLCQATVENGVCLAAENTVPPQILRQLRAALSDYRKDAG